VQNVWQQLTMTMGNCLRRISTRLYANIQIIVGETWGLSDGSRGELVDVSVH